MARGIKWYENAAASENDWVRARILKQDHEEEREGRDLFQIATRARDMACEALGDCHPAYAIALLNLGLYYEVVQDNVQKAEELFAQARDVLGENHNAIAEALYWLGVFQFEAKENSERAEVLLDRSVSILRKSPDSDPLQLADTLICLAYAKENTVGLQGAIPVMKEAMEIQNTALPANDKRILDTSERLAQMLERIPWAELSEQVLERLGQAGTNQAEKGEESAEAQARDLTMLGNVYLTRTLGAAVEDVEMAIANYEKASSMMSKAGKLTESACIAVLLAVAYDCRLTGHRSENTGHMFVHTDWALEFLEPDEDAEIWAVAKMMRGKAFHDRAESQGLGRTDRDIALRCFDEALSILNRDEHPELWAQTHYEIGCTYTLMLPGDDPNKVARMAIDHFRQALHVFTRSTDPQQWALIHAQLGNLYAERAQARGRADSQRLTRYAVNHLEHALSVYTRKNALERWARVQFALGRVYARDDRRGADRKAIGHFNKALSVFDRETYPDDRLKVLSALSSLLFARRQWAQAAPLLKEAREISAALLEKSYSMEARWATIAATANLDNQLAHCLCQSNDFDNALIEVEAGKSRLLAATLMLNELDERSLSSENREALGRLLPGIRKLEATASSGGMRDIGDADRLVDARGALKEVLDRIRAQHPGVLPKQLTVAQMAPTTAGSALIIPLITDLGSTVFVLPHGATAMIPENVISLPDFTTGTMEQLLLQVDGRPPGWLVTLQQESGGNERWRAVIDQVTGRLWDLFMEPVVRRLCALDVHQIIFLPQGGLQFLPLHAVWHPVDNRRHYLLDDFIVTYAPSAYVLAIASRREQSHALAERPVIAGVSDYKSLPQLPNVREEVKRIARFFNTTPLLNEDATREALIEAVSGASLVHFACHGLSSALDLWPNWGWEAPITLHLWSGGLTFGDILSELDLRQTCLVTLSACDTGLVEVRKSWDEFVGLPSAFLQAGAGAIVSSLWAVDDRSTALLMERFYHNAVDKEMSLGAALREAQIWLRGNTRQALDDFDAARTLGDKARQVRPSSGVALGAKVDMPYAHPYYWAPFFLSGA